MKYLLAGDFHGRSLEPLRNLEFDVLLSTGDFDHPDIIREFIEMKRDLESKGKDVLLAPGNHDDAVYRGQNISSGTLRQQKTTVPELHSELHNRPEEKDFLQRALKQRLEELTISGRNAVLVHGALAGNMASYPDCPPDKKIFWRRLLSEENHKENFNEMKSRGHRLMIRGHDHEPEYVRQRDNRVEIQENTSTKYQLNDDEIHTITHGPWFDGWYATIETDSAYPTLEFHNIDQ